MMPDIHAWWCHANSNLMQLVSYIMIYLNQMHHGSWDKTARFQNEILDNVTINASRVRCLLYIHDKMPAYVHWLFNHEHGYQDLCTIINILPINVTFLRGFTYHVIMVLQISTDCLGPQPLLVDTLSPSPGYHQPFVRSARENSSSSGKANVYRYISHER